MISCGNRVFELKPAATTGISRGRRSTWVILKPTGHLLRVGPTVVGEVEALLDQGIDIDWPMLSRALSECKQHVLDNRVAAFRSPRRP